jgi:hypothetical protein
MASVSIGASYKKVDTIIHTPMRLAGERAETTVNIAVIDAVTVYPPGTLFGIVTATDQAVVSTATAVDGSQVPVAIAPYGINLFNEVACGAVVGGTVRKTVIARGRFDVSEITALADPSWGSTHAARYKALFPILKASGLFLNLPMYSTGDGSQTLVDAVLVPGQRIAMDGGDAGVRVFYAADNITPVVVPLAQQQYAELKAAGIVQ